MSTPDCTTFSTLAIHAGFDPDPITGDVVPPIHVASTFVQDRPGELREGYEYGRCGNPTTNAFAGALAAPATPGEEHDSETRHPSLAVSALLGAPRAVRTRALREAARAAGIRALSSAHVDALDDLVVAWRGQGPIDLPGGTASRVGRGAHARIAFVAREVGAPTVPDPD